MTQFARSWLLSAALSALVALCALSAQAGFPGTGRIYPQSTGTPKVLTYQTSANDATAQTTYTYTSQTFGTASSGRCIIVTAFAAPTGGNPAQAISSATLGGISATIIDQVNGGANGDGTVGVLIAAVPTGTTGTVAVTYGGTMARAAIAVWAATGLAGCTTSNDHFSTTGAIANVMWVTLNTLSGGFVVGMAAENADDGATSWTNATSRIDSTVGGARYTGADNSGTSSGSLAVSASPFSSAHRAMSAASW